MKNFYKILEVKPEATDAEIKQSFIKLKNKYDPSNYDKSNLKQIAIEKTKEIEQAFDEIMNSRRLDRLQHGKSPSDANENKSESSSSYRGSATSGSSSSSFVDYDHIESLINSGCLDEAQNLLNSVGESERMSAWFYLKGLLLFKKGWLEDATDFLGVAVRMNPGNRKYAALLQQVRMQQRGNFGPFNNGQFNRGPYYQNTSCGFCDSCMGFMCANAICSCCEDNALGGC